MGEILPYRDGYSRNGVGELLRIYCRLGGIYDFCQEFLIIMDDGRSIGARKVNSLVLIRSSRRSRDKGMKQYIYHCQEIYVRDEPGLIRA
jgi:hypothetical protein